MLCSWQMVPLRIQAEATDWGAYFRYRTVLAVAFELRGVPWWAFMDHRQARRARREAEAGRCRMPRLLRERNAIERKAIELAVGKFHRGKMLGGRR